MKNYKMLQNYAIILWYKDDLCGQNSVSLDRGWLSGAMMLVNFQHRDVLLIWIIVRHGLSALEADVGLCYFDIFLSAIISLFFPPLSWRRSDIDGNTSQRAGKPKTTNQPING